MKKLSIFAFAALTSAALVSCVQEKTPDGTVSVGENDLAFVLGSAPVTRASSEAEATVNDYDLKVPSIGKILHLEETVTTLDAACQDSPATRGTPAYTENIASLYGAFSLNAFAIPAAGQALGDKVIADGNAEPQGDGHTWIRRFNGDPWDGNSQLYFFMRMPDAQSGVVSSDNAPLYTYAYANGTGRISFKYKSPSLATNQQDILFSGRPIAQSDRPASGIPVLFQHALTAVKFRMGNELDLNDATKTRTYITKVEFIGLRNSGSCTVTPDPETNYTDVQDIYSSETAVSWTFGEGDTRSTASDPIYQTFGDDDLVDYGQADRKFPDSFYADRVTADGKSGLDKNLNDENATMTFWLIPQVLDENVKVRVHVKIKAGDDINNGPDGEGNICVLDLGTQLSGTEWKAGQLRTFTIKPDVVGIKITDEMTENRTVKENVVIKNLGNVKEYVRVNIIANWVGFRQIGIDGGGNPVYEDHETVLFGYQSAAQDGAGNYIDDTEVLAWNDKDPEYTFLDGTTVTASSGILYTHNGTDYRRYGTFIGLPAKSVSTNDPSTWDDGNGWVRFDKYYYYESPIGPGDSVFPASTPLFTSYTVNPSPTYYIADEFGIRRKAKDVHLEMDILVQAIKVPVDPVTGDDLDFITAWKQTLPSGQNDLDDL